MTFEEEMEKSGLSNLDKMVETIYRYCDCTFCKVSGVDCPFIGCTDEDITEETNKICKGKIKENILKAARVDFNT